MRWKRGSSGSGRLPLQRRTIGRLVTANISLDAGTLAAIDEGAAAHGLTRSAFMASAALEKIRRELEPAALGRSANIF